MQNSNRVLRQSTLALVGCMLSLVTHAGADTSIAEIIVTAEKIAEPLSKVPASIGVLTAADLDQQKAVDLQDVINRVPGVASDFAGAPGTSTVSIRGISPGGGSLTTTGAYFDDVSISMLNNGFHGAYEPAFLDLDRIEVLRGPQGTLYGADSFGGAIRFVSKQPQLDRFSGDLDSNFYTQAGGDPGEAVRAAVNLPLIDHTLALRLSGIYQHDGGFIDHVASDGTGARNDTNTQNISGVRAILLWQPMEQLKITPTLDYQLTRNADTWFYDPSLGQYNTPRALNEPVRDRFLLGALNVNWDFGTSTLTSVSSYVDRQFDRIQDFTVYDMSSFVAPVLASYFDPTNAKGSLAALSGVLTPAYHNDENKQWHQEVRLASHFDPIGLETLVGLYYSHETLDRYSLEDAQGLGAQTERLFGLSANQALSQAFGTGPGAADLGDDLTLYDYRIRIDRKAVYFKGTWTPPYSGFDKWKLAAGGRVSRITYEKDGYLDGFFDGGYSTIQDSFKESQVAPEYNLSYQATDNALLYASASKGFRLGGTNSPLPFTCDAEIKSTGITPTSSYKTDSIWDYEVGTKVGFLNHAVQINASAYHINWTNIAESILYPICGFSFTSNLGKATSDGGDISLQLRPLSGLDIELGVAYTDAQFSTSVNLAGLTKGTPVPFSPPWTGNASVSYTWPIGTSNAYVRADYNYTDVSRGGIFASQENFNRPAYDTVGASAGLQQGPWDLSIYGKNLTDAHPALEQQTVYGYNNISTLRPRQIGFAVNYNF